MTSKKIPEDYLKYRLGKYYISKKTPTLSNKKIMKLDDKDILLFKIPYTEKFDYYPVSIALFALEKFDEFLDTKKPESKNLFIKQADWLVENIINKGNFGIWEHKYELPYYSFKIPWVHGMAQGLSISVLLRAYQLTNNKKYLENAKLSLNSFQKTISMNGVKYIDKSGDIWFEEYALSTPPHVLNGFIYALFGIYEYYILTKNNESLNLWQSGIKTLEKNLDKYDFNYWSRYDLFHRYPATKAYHRIHIKQLKILYVLTKKTIFKEYAEKWEKCYNSFFNRSRANIVRIVLHIKRYGVMGVIKQYKKRKKWIRK